jgi:hypothetical protein
VRKVAANNDARSRAKHAHAPSFSRAAYEATRAIETPGRMHPHPSHRRALPQAKLADGHFRPRVWRWAVVSSGSPLAATPAPPVPPPAGKAAPKLSAEGIAATVAAGGGSGGEARVCGGYVRAEAGWEDGPAAVRWAGLKGADRAVEVGSAVAPESSVSAIARLQPCPGRSLSPTPGSRCSGPRLVAETPRVVAGTPRRSFPADSPAPRRRWCGATAATRAGCATSCGRCGPDRSPCQPPVNTRLMGFAPSPHCVPAEEPDRPFCGASPVALRSAAARNGTANGTRTDRPRLVRRVAATVCSGL